MEKDLEYYKRKSDLLEASLLRLTENAINPPILLQHLDYKEKYDTACEEILKYRRLWKNIYIKKG